MGAVFPNCLWNFGGLCFFAMKFKFSFLNLAKIQIFIPKSAFEGGGGAGLRIIPKKKQFFSASLTESSENTHLKKWQKRYSVVALQVSCCYKTDVKSGLLQRTSLLKMMMTAILETLWSLFNNNEVIWWEVEWKPFPDIDERETSWNMTAPL